jgi:DNA-binding response OmpR family regulator
MIDSVKLRSKDFYTKEEVIETIERHKLKESTGELFLTSGLPDITIDGIHISPQMHLVTSGDTIYQLNKKQFSLLYLLMSNRDTIMSSSELFKTVWGVDYKNDQTLTWYMSRVRKVAPNNIFNIKGKGYIWRSK